MYNEGKKKNERRIKDSSTVIPGFVCAFINGNAYSFYRRALNVVGCMFGVRDP